VYRRTFLATVGATGSLAGCLSAVVTERDATPTGSGAPAARGATDEATTDGATGETGTARDTATPTAVAERGRPADICEQGILYDSGILAIDEPAVAPDWQDREIEAAYRDDEQSGLAPGQTVVGLTGGGRARAYPLSVLTLHEVVNDDFGGPVLVTYCPLCRSAVVAERVVDGERTTFGVSGRLWQPPETPFKQSAEREGVVGASEIESDRVEELRGANLVLYDRATRSYWSQLLAEAICGPQTGTTLSLRPATVATWEGWRTDHPDTDVLLPPPHSGVFRPSPDVEKSATPGE